MKRFLSLLVMFLCLYGTKAQENETTMKWSQSINGVESAADAYRKSPTAVTSDGEVYVTGKFNQIVATEKFYLEPIAQSSFLTKYDSDGTELWAVALAGTATISTITTDDAGNVYIAGTLADQVVFNSTSGSSVTLAGEKAEDGSYITEETSSFIAKYDANGVLKATKSFVPSINPEILNYINEYFYDGSNKFLINHIETDGDNVYASASYIGTINSDNHKFLSSLSYIDGWMIIDIPHYALFTVSAENLDNTSVVAEIKPQEAIQSSDIKLGPICMTFTLDEGTIYIGAIGNGQLTLSTEKGDTGFDFSPEYDEEWNTIMKYGHIIASIGKDGVKSNTYYSTSTNDNKIYETIGAMQVENNTLYIGGVFYGSLAYNPAMTSVQTSDLYAVALNKNTLEQEWSCQSNFNEGENNYYNEVFTTMNVHNGTVAIHGYSEKTDDYTLQSALNYSIVNGSSTTLSDDQLITGVSINGTNMARLSLDGTQTVVNAYNVAPSAINTIEQKGNLRIGNVFYFSEPTDARIYDVQGRLLISKTQTESLDINNLNQGMYILSNGKESIKVLKK